MRTKIEFTGSIFASQSHGGVSKYVTELARGLLALDKFTISIDAPLYINRYLKEAASTLGHRGVFLRKRFRGTTACNQFATIALSTCRKPEILHLTYYDDMPGRNNVPRVCTFYDMIQERFFPTDPICERKKACFQASDRSIAISESTKRDMCEIWDADPSRIDVVPLASGLSAIPTRFVDPVSRPYLLWVGNRSAYKNFHRTAVAIARTDVWRSGCELVLAGGPVPTAREKQGWSDIGLDCTRVRYERPSDQKLATLYSNALMLVYTSGYEGFGIPPLEAMQYRCPVIAANSSSIPEVVGDAGILIDAESIDAMTVAIDRIASDRQVREDFVDAGLARATQFSWSKCAQKTAAVYQNVLAAR